MPHFRAGIRPSGFITLPWVRRICPTILCMRSWMLCFHVTNSSSKPIPLRPKPFRPTSHATCFYPFTTVRADGTAPMRQAGRSRAIKLVGHSVRSSVLCGPVSCREVDHVAATNESVARLECGGADGVDAVEPVAAYAGGSGRAGGGVAGG